MLLAQNWPKTAKSSWHNPFNCARISAVHRLKHWPVADAQVPGSLNVNLVEYPATDIGMHSNDTQPTINQESMEFQPPFTTHVIWLVNELLAVALNHDCTRTSQLWSPSFFTDAADQQERLALIQELQTLIHVGRHPNIVSLVGACTFEGKTNGALIHCAFLESKIQDRIFSSTWKIATYALIEIF